MEKQKAQGSRLEAQGQKTQKQKNKTSSKSSEKTLESGGKQAKASSQKTLKTSKFQKPACRLPAGRQGKARFPQTMEELLAKTGYQLHGFKRGEEVEGRIVFLSPKEILVDIGGKTEGTVARKELPFLRELISSLKTGDKVITRILLPEGERGRPLLSIKKSADKKKWQNLEEKAKKEEEIEVLARKTTRGGLLVEYQDLRGFIPQSQLDPQIASTPRNLLGRKIKVKILEVDHSLNRLVVSQRAVTQKGKIQKLKKALQKIKINQVLEMEVSGIVPFGLFCQIDNLEGLVHISEIAWERVENPGDFYKVKDKIKVKVLGVLEKEGKLNLSIKQLTVDPWGDVVKKYKKDQIVKGEVIRVSAFGAFVVLEKGVEGLIHISKIPPEVEFKKGQKIECVVEKIDKKGRKISLSYLPTEKPVGYK